MDRFNYSHSNYFKFIFQKYYIHTFIELYNTRFVCIFHFALYIRTPQEMEKGSENTVKHVISLEICLIFVTLKYKVHGSKICAQFTGPYNKTLYPSLEPNKMC